MNGNQRTENEQPLHYLKHIILAFLGGILGVLVWIMPLYSNVIYPMTIVSIGIFSAIGARGFQKGKGNIRFGIIAVIVSLICLLIGDVLETLIRFNNSQIGFKEFIDIAQFKVDETPVRLFYYFITPIAAFLVGNGKQ